MCFNARMHGLNTDGVHALCKIINWQLCNSCNMSATQPALMSPLSATHWRTVYIPRLTLHILPYASSLAYSSYWHIWCQFETPLCNKVGRNTCISAFTQANGMSCHLYCSTFAYNLKTGFKGQKRQKAPNPANWNHPTIIVAHIA